MTGYGRGESVQAGCKITVELNSVNRRQSEIAVYLPRELESLEAQVRNEINRRIARGRLIVRIGWERSDGAQPGGVNLNLGLAREYARQLRCLARELGMEETLTLEVLTRAPGVLQSEDRIADATVYWPALAKALRQAIEGLIAMREREGAHLEKDLRSRVTAMQRSVKRIRRQAPLVAKYYRKQLEARLKEAGLALPVLDDQRLLQEVVIFADRADISEELARLESHFQQTYDCLESSEPVGRTLDFLAQEMNREVNTIGSKANDGGISHEVVRLKTELEKFREQVQNIE